MKILPLVPLVLMVAWASAPIAQAQSIPYDPVTGEFGPLIGMNVGNIGLGFFRDTGELFGLDFRGQEIAGTDGSDSLTSGLLFSDGLASKNVTGVRREGSSLKLSGTEGNIPFETTYSVLEQSTLQVSTTWASMPQPAVAYSQFYAASSFTDRVPMISNQGNTFAGVLGSFPMNSIVVAGSSDQDASVYAGIARQDANLPPVKLRTPTVPPTVLPPTGSGQLAEFAEIDSGGKSFGSASHRVGVSKSLEPSTEPQTLTATFSFVRDTGSLSLEATLEEFSSIYDATIAPTPITSRISSGGAKDLLGENPAVFNAQWVWVGTLLPHRQATPFPNTVDVETASGFASWSSDRPTTFGLGFFNIDELNLVIALDDFERTIFSDQIYRVRYEGVQLGIDPSDLQFITTGTSIFGVGPGNGDIDPSNVSLIGGRCIITPIPGPGEDSLPAFVRDFSINPLLSFDMQAAGIPNARPTRVTVWNADVLYPENLLLAVELNAAFRPFDHLPPLVIDSLFVTSPIVVGVPEISPFAAISLVLTIIAVLRFRFVSLFVSILRFCTPAPGRVFFRFGR
jgi:hypothetical protein